MLKSAAHRRQLKEFVLVTGFNAVTLALALVAIGHTEHSRTVTVALSHTTSALLSYAFCTTWIWPRRGETADTRSVRAAWFFALALISALASVALSNALRANTGSAKLITVNYTAVGAIAIVKFAIQKWAMTTDRLAPQHTRA